MQIVTSDNYQKYLEDNGIDESWQRRDFVTEVEKYIDSTLSKVLLVSGLRGTGKSVGLLQAIANKDAVYLIAEKGITTTADDVLELLRQRTERVIVLDEYTWITNRNDSDLDAFLYTLVAHGKRVIVTGTESLSIEALKAGALIHRAFTIHTTHMSFSEYCRLYNKAMDQYTCDEYLQRGGIFENYVINNKMTMTKYVEEAIISNLKSYVQTSYPHYTDTEISNMIYTLLYRAICDLVKCNPKLLKEDMDSQIALQRLGVDLEMSPVLTSDLQAVADLLCSAGVLVKVPNLLNEQEGEVFPDYKTYVVNPSLTCQFIKAAFPTFDNTKAILGLVYEASCMTDLYFKKQAADSIYFLESHDANNYEIDVVIVTNSDMSKKQIYLFECKHRYRVNVYNENWSIVNGRVDAALQQAFPDSEICGRFIIHPGEAAWQQHKSGREVAVVNQDKNLYEYYKFDDLKDKLKTLNAITAFK